MKIPFLAANPVDVVTQLRIDQGIREIRRKIRMSTFRDNLEIVSEWAVRAGDLQEALLRHKPDIVHFSGHGSQTSGIMLEDESGNRKAVNRKALRDLFRILKDNIQMVVLNACAVCPYRNQPDGRCLAPVIYQRRRSAGHSLYDHTIRSHRVRAPDQFACGKGCQLRHL